MDVTKIIKQKLILNPFKPNVPFLYYLKISENLWFSANKLKSKQTIFTETERNKHYCTNSQQ